FPSGREGSRLPAVAPEPAARICGGTMGPSEASSETATEQAENLAGEADRLPATIDGWALFLDVDGTLIDIAVSPDAVVVPDGLPNLLIRLLERTGGAMALVTGRSIATVDRLFAPARLPVAGVHGSEIRFLDGALWEAPRPATLDIIADKLRRFVAL